MSKKNNIDAATAIENALNDEECLERAGSLLKRLFDGEPVNKNPLSKLPKPEMQLYYVYGYYFETENDAKTHCKSKGISTNEICVVSYLRNCAGRSDVIMKKYNNGRVLLYTAVDEDGYGIYNNERSIYRGEFIWEFNYGHIKEMYIPFRDRGIVFENDIYAKIDEQDKNLLEYCKKYKLFNYK